MITIILYGLMILFLSIPVGYLARHIILKMAKQKAELLFESKQMKIKFMQKLLDSEYERFEEIKQREQNNIAGKKAELMRIQEQSQETMKLAKEIHESAMRKVKILERRVSQMQSELYQARKRAERLANKAKNAVQI